MPWEEALQQIYKLTPAQLAQVYGQSIGIPTCSHKKRLFRRNGGTRRTRPTLVRR